MIERDYIMRMIQMLVQALVQILFHKRGGQYPEALGEIQKASKTLIGVELDVIRRLTDIQIIELLSLVKIFGVPKCYVAGRLLKEEAEVFAFQGKNPEVRDLLVKSLSLMTEAAVQYGGPTDADHAAAIEEVARALPIGELPVHVQKKMFRYYETIHRYGKAEDAMFLILDMEPGFSVDGGRFYERLQKKSDEELLEGNFSRGEIEEGIAELARRR